jgi:hypothetical protein
MIAAPGAVARDMDDAAAGVRRLEAEAQGGRPDRGRTPRPWRSSSMMAPAPPLAMRLGNCRIVEAVARPPGCRRRAGRPIVLAHGGGDAALGPGRSRPFGQRHLGQQDDGPRAPA